MQPSFRLAALIFALLATAAPAFASSRAADSFPAARAAKAPPLDASLSDPVWQSALSVGGLQTITTQKPASDATQMLLLYDDVNLYVGLRAEQRDTPITATQSANNVGFGLDDFVGIGLDTSGNGTNVYFFMTTPRGTRYQQSSESSRYAPPWTAVTARTANGWNAMFVIPLKVLRTPSSPSQTWRVNVVRRIAARDVNETWAYDPIMNDGGGGTNNFPLFSDARYWPRLTGLRLATTASHRQPRAELYTLASGGGDRGKFQAADGSFVSSGARHAGVDIVVPVTGTASFVAAIAPDYSNVEIDQQTIAPQEFRRALSEYRPFFSQGASFFDPSSLIGINAPPNRIFYSPAIGPFDRGLKLEGTQGLQSFGALEVQGAGFDDMAFGYRHATPSRSFTYSLDGVTTHHQAGNETIDPRAGNDATWQAQVTGRNPRTGFVFALDYAREHGTFVADDRLAFKTEDFVDVHRGNYETYLGYRNIGPQYAPVLGYTQNADIRGPQAYVDLNGTLSPRGPVKRIDLFLTGDRYLDRSGAVHQADANVSLDVQLKNGFHISGGPYTSQLRTYDSGLVGYPFYAHGVTRSYNQHSINLGYKDGTPAPVDVSYSFGPFGDLFLQQTTFSTSRTIATRWTVGAELDAARERSLFGGPTNGQWLRRVTVGENVDRDTNFTISLRGISGTGGFAAPGVNLAGSFHHRFRNDSELFVNYGTPAAPATLARLVVKYVLRTGGGAGT